jgi:hypothetical protein
MFLQLTQTGSKEVKIGIGEIAEVVVKHKDDKTG